MEGWIHPPSHELGCKILPKRLRQPYAFLQGCLNSGAKVRLFFGIARKSISFLAQCLCKELLWRYGHSPFRLQHSCPYVDFGRHKTKRVWFNPYKQIRLTYEKIVATYKRKAYFRPIWRIFPPHPLIFCLILQPLQPSCRESTQINTSDMPIN